MKKPTAEQIREADKRTGSEGRQRGNARGSEGCGDTIATAKTDGLLWQIHTHTQSAAAAASKAATTSFLSFSFYLSMCLFIYLHVFYHYPISFPLTLVALPLSLSIYLSFYLSSISISPLFPCCCGSSSLSVSLGFLNNKERCNCYVTDNR